MFSPSGWVKVTVLSSGLGASRHRATYVIATSRQCRCRVTTASCVQFLGTAWSRSMTT